MIDDVYSQSPIDLKSVSPEAKFFKLTDVFKASSSDFMFPQS